MTPTAGPNTSSTFGVAIDVASQVRTPERLGRIWSADASPAAEGGWTGLHIAWIGSR
jgi:hypothetical protein